MVNDDHGRQAVRWKENCNPAGVTDLPGVIPFLLNPVGLRLPWQVALRAAAAAAHRIQLLPQAPQHRLMLAVAIQALSFSRAPAPPDYVRKMHSGYCPVLATRMRDLSIRPSSCASSSKPDKYHAHASVSPARCLITCSYQLMAMVYRRASCVRSQAKREIVRHAALQLRLEQASNRPANRRRSGVAP